MTRTRTTATALVAVCAGLLAPSAALANDAEIRQAVTDGSAKIVKQEKKVAAAGKSFSQSKRPSKTRLRKFRAAAREEEAVIRSIRKTLLGFTPDTEPVGTGRTFMAQGLAIAATGLDRVEKALGRLQNGGSAKANKRSIEKGLKELEEGNKLIEQGEPLVGVQLTPNTPAPATS